MDRVVVVVAAGIQGEISGSRFLRCFSAVSNRHWLATPKRVDLDHRFSADSTPAKVVDWGVVNCFETRLLSCFLTMVVSRTQPVHSLLVAGTTAAAVRSLRCLLDTLVSMKCL